MLSLHDTHSPAMLSYQLTFDHVEDIIREAYWSIDSDRILEEIDEGICLGIYNETSKS